MEVSDIFTVVRSFIVVERVPCTMVNSEKVRLSLSYHVSI